MEGQTPSGPPDGTPVVTQRAPRARPLANLFAQEQKGQVLVILALFIVVLCAFVGLITDVARAQLDAVYTQRGSDAGSLAGVIFMPDSYTVGPCKDAKLCDDAITRAYRALAQNGFENHGEPLGTDPTSRQALHDYAQGGGAYPWAATATTPPSTILRLSSRSGISTTSACRVCRATRTNSRWMLAGVSPLRS